MATIEVGRGDQAATVRATIGDTIVVRLPENPTTGYAWEVQGDTLVGLRLAADDYVADRPSTLGGGGQRTLTFGVVEAGTWPLVLRLRRAWEPPEAYAEELALTVSVRQ